MSIDASQLRHEVIRPVLHRLGIHSDAAEALVLGTACVESDCGRYLKQLGNGPALGIFQMEPATHNDIWANFLSWNGELRQRVQYLSVCYGNGMGAQEMVGNIYYAAAMCRIHYRRVKEALPLTLEGQAAYWKRYYNTHLGKGTEEKYLEAWNRHVGD